jgi:SCY1-like protein 1
MTEYTSQQREFAISWGVHQVSKGLGFLINDCNLKHNNIFVGSIFVTSTGNWKIAGFEYVTPVTDTSYPNKNISNLDKYIPPEVSTGRLGINKYSFDSWGLGCLIHEVFNGEVSSSNGFKSPGKVPKSLSSFLSELLSQNPSKRPAPLDFIEKCRSPNGFMKNAFIDSMLFLDEIQIKDQTAKNRFFSNLDSQLENFPSDVCKNRILPSLISAFEFGDAGAAVLGPLFKISKLLEEEDYQKRIVPCIVKLFSSKDRATRAKLLQQSEFFVKHINNNIINTQVYPNVSQGFLDNNPTIREQTVKSMLHFAPKLNAVNLNEDLLKQFARIQSRDEEGGIRTNTVVCLAKIACYLQPGVSWSYSYEGN